MEHHMDGNIWTLRDEGIAATIKVDGAELCSLKNAGGLELLWQAGPAWPRHAPLLFPIVGRLKDMVIRGGENVYPREIEEFLYRHPAIQDVQVIGVPDLKYGEEICAWIKLSEGRTATAEEIREVLLHTAVYAGIPAANRAFAVAQRVIVPAHSDGPPG